LLGRISQDTANIQRAINACAGKGGGTVILKAPHTYLVYSINLNGSNLELNIEQGATLVHLHAHPCNSSLVVIIG
jgi:polygalacturonase